jgi:hypothetical protein
LVRDFCLVALGACDSAKAPTPSFDWRAAVTTLNYNDDDRDEDRRLAAVMLGVHRQSEAIAMLIEHLERDADPKVRAACASPWDASAASRRSRRCSNRCPIRLRWCAGKSCARWTAASTPSAPCVC